MTKEKKMRSSNIELLRCTAMLMIVAYHIVCHCVNIQLTDRGSMERLANGLFNHPTFYKKLLIPGILNSFGITGNAIFILISGYFMVQKKGRDIDIVKIAKKLLCQLGFASVLLTLASTICFHVMSGTFFNLVNIQIFNYMSWFAGYYFAVILTAMLFLNDFLAKMDSRGYLTFLTVSFAVIQFVWTGGLADSFMPASRTFLTGIFLYALGGYFKKYDPLSKLRISVFFLAVLITYFFVILSAYNSIQTNIEEYFRNNSQDIFIQQLPGFPNYSFIVIIIAVCLFEIFRRIRIPRNKFLNYLGQSTFMIYLVHDNEFFYSIFDTQDWITLLYSNPAGFIFKIFIWSAVIFACGVTVYAVYNLLAGLFEKYKWILFKKEYRG